MTGALESPGGSSYEYTIRHDGRMLVSNARSEEPTIPLNLPDHASVAAYLAQHGAHKEEDRVIEIDLRTRREGALISKSVRVYLHFPLDGSPPRIAGLERET